MSKVVVRAEGSVVTTIPEAIGRSGFVTATFRNLPVRYWPEEDRRLCADPDFSTNVNRQIYRFQAFFTLRKGFPVRRHFCRQCELELNATLLEPYKFIVELPEQGVPGYQLEITTLAVICPECWTASAARSVGIYEAIEDALIAEGIG